MPLRTRLYVYLYSKYYFRSSQEAIEQRFSSLDVFPISDVTYAQRLNDLSGSNWKLFDVYKVSSDLPLIISELTNVDCCKNVHGDWKQNLTILDSVPDTKPLRYDLRGIKLTCGLVVSTRKLEMIFFFNET